MNLVLSCNIIVVSSLATSELGDYYFIASDFIVLCVPTTIIK
jgi:hypothetical protein